MEKRGNYCRTHNPTYSEDWNLQNTAWSESSRTWQWMTLLRRETIRKCIKGISAMPGNIVLVQYAPMAILATKKIAKRTMIPSPEGTRDEQCKLPTIWFVKFFLSRIGINVRGHRIWKWSYSNGMDTYCYTKRKDTLCTTNTKGMLERDTPSIVDKHFEAAFCTP